MKEKANQDTCISGIAEAKKQRNWKFNDQGKIGIESKQSLIHRNELVDVLGFQQLCCTTGGGGEKTGVEFVKNGEEIENDHFNLHNRDEEFEQRALVDLKRSALNDQKYQSL